MIGEGKTRGMLQRGWVKKKKKTCFDQVRIGWVGGMANYSGLGETDGMALTGWGVRLSKVLDAITG